MTTPTQTGRRRRHLAKRSWGPGGLAIRCTCGQWQSTKGTQVEQDDAHREHRWRMGEIPKPTKVSPIEQLRTDLEELRQSAQRDATVVDLVKAWAASTERGEAAAEVLLLLAAGNAPAAELAAAGGRR